MNEPISETHDKLLSYLGYCLAQGQGTVIVTGAGESGRSDLAERLLERIVAPDLTVADVDVRAWQDRSILSAIANAFELPGSAADDPRAMAELETFLHSQAREGQRCLLVLRNAHLLSDAGLATVQTCAAFRLGSRRLMQVLLLGEPAFSDRLAAEDLAGLRDGIIAIHELEDAQVSLDRNLQQGKGVRDVQAALAGLASVLDKRHGGARSARPDPVPALRPLAGDDMAERVTALETRCARLEEVNARQAAKLEEQERTLRHTLEMLIEWIESGDLGRRSA